MTGFWSRFAATLAFLALLIAAPAFAADTKVSAFTDGAPVLFDDELGMARAGDVRKADVEDLIGFGADGLQLRRWRFFDDFWNETATTADAGQICIESNTGTGAVSSLQALATTNRIGVTRSTSGTTATGRATFTCSPVTMIAGGAGTLIFEAAVNVTTLSTSTERYQFVIGFSDTLTAVGQVDAIAFVYDEGGVVTGCGASANWQRMTASNSTRTCTASSTAVSAGSWTRLRIVCNAGGTSCEWFVNGTSIGTNTTNIPTGTARVFGLGSMWLKSVGTTARTLDLDYMLAVLDFTTAR